MLNVEKFLLPIRKTRIAQWAIRALDSDKKVQLKELSHPIYVQSLRSTTERFSRSYEVEREVSDVIKFILENCDIQTFVDVGANIGFYSWFALDQKLQLRVIALEPDYRNAVTFSRTANRWAQGDVCLVTAALAPQNGPIEFFMDDVTGKTGSIIEVYDGENFAEKFFNQRRRAISVAGVTLPSVLSMTVGQTLLKLDIEGGERTALENFGDAIMEEKPLIVIELNRHNVDWGLDFFEKIGFEILPVSKDGYLDKDYLAFPKKTLSPELEASLRQFSIQKTPEPSSVRPNK